MCGDPSEYGRVLRIDPRDRQLLRVAGVGPRIHISHLVFFIMADCLYLCCHVKANVNYVAQTQIWSFMTCRLGSYRDLSVTPVR